MSEKLVEDFRIADPDQLAVLDKVTGLLWQHATPEEARLWQTVMLTRICAPCEINRSQA